MCVSFIFDAPGGEIFDAAQTGGDFSLPFIFLFFSTQREAHFYRLCFFHFDAMGGGHPPVRVSCLSDANGWDFPLPLPFVFLLSFGFSTDDTSDDESTIDVGSIDREMPRVFFCVV